MKRKILMKFSVISLVALCMVGSFSLCLVNASSLQNDSSNVREDITDEETTENSSTDTNRPKTRSNHLNFGTGRITKVANNQCNLVGVVQAYHNCDMLYLDLYLEQKSNGEYSTYKTWKFTSANAALLTKEINVLVPKNHYYRLVGYHAAKEGGIKESTTTQTKGVWIGD